MTPYNVTYNGAAHTATGSSTGAQGENLSGLDLSGTTRTSAGTTVDTWTFTDTTGNYTDATGTVSDAIAKAAAVVSVTPYNVTYNGAAHTATGSATGVLGESLAGLALGGTTHTNVGTTNDGWTFTDVTGNYADASGTANDVISKATAVIAVTPYGVTFDGAAHTATGAATGVLGESLSGLNLSTTTHTNAGGYADSWTFTDATGNYTNTTGTANDSITKASAAIVVTPYNVTYNGAARTATGTATGLLGVSLSGLNLSGTTHTGAGTYADTWTFTDVTGNYADATGTASDVIAKAAATIVITPYGVTYDGAPHTATGSAIGVLGESLGGLNLSATTHTNAGTTTDAWTFTDGTGNYADKSGTVTDAIAQGAATITVTPYSVTYDGAAHTAVGTATGVLGESLAGLNLAGTTHTNAGTYADTWTFTDVSGNYADARGTANDAIARATATITVTRYNVAYNGLPHTATGSATGVLGESLGGLNLGATTHTNAGTTTDAWTFTDGTGNYADKSGTVTDAIAQVAATITVTPYSVTYDGAAHTASGTATGVLGESLAGLNMTGTTHSNAGTYADTWTFADPAGNYVSATGNVNDAIAMAASMTSLTSSSASHVTASGQAVTFTASVSSPSGVPTGTVQFQIDGVNSGAPVALVNGTAAFSTTALAVGQHAIVAVYGGNNNVVGSTSAPMNHLVFAYTAGGNFVIGDRNAAIGTPVTFWSAQWEKTNSLSGGPSQASFKGFANSTSTAPPAGGGTWTTNPGNSSNPPASIGSYIAVIVSSSVTKSGSTISGNTVRVVIVRTDAGYQANPGHAGTGTVVAVVTP